MVRDFKMEYKFNKENPYDFIYDKSLSIEEKRELMKKVLEEIF
jgi:hypothetical protein